MHRKRERPNIHRQLLISHCPHLSRPVAERATTCKIKNRSQYRWEQWLWFRYSSRKGRWLKHVMGGETEVTWPSWLDAPPHRFCYLHGHPHHGNVNPFQIIDAEFENQMPWPALLFGVYRFFPLEVWLLKLFPKSIFSPLSRCLVLIKGDD